MTEPAANDNAYFDQVTTGFALEWDRRVETMDGPQFQAEDMLEAHGTPIAYIVASAIQSGYTRDHMLTTVVKMLNDAIDVDLAMMGHAIPQKELN